jgi:nitrite reductase/ring-hydroxylating ferredoxin subunit
MSHEAMLKKRLCRLEELPAGAKLDALGFAEKQPGQAGLFVIRHGGAVRVYVNRCPHRGTPLNWSPDRFVDLEREHIVCATHGAKFRVEDGECISGPCRGDRLEHVKAEVRDGVVYIADRNSSEPSPD